MDEDSTLNREMDFFLNYFNSERSNPSKHGIACVIVSLSFTTLNKCHNFMVNIDQCSQRRIFNISHSLSLLHPHIFPYTLESTTWDKKIFINTMKIINAFLCKRMIILSFNSHHTIISYNTINQQLVAYTTRYALPSLVFFNLMNVTLTSHNTFTHTH